jgi:branched-chain amino acid transport system ATP-binding protein
VEVKGEPILRAKPHRMARLGVTRTFQSIRLFGDLTVLDNVMVGFHLHLRASFFAHLVRTRGVLEEEAAFRRRAVALLELVGIAERVHDLAQNLSYGQQRLLEIALALATRPRVLLLDEPAAGVPKDESAELFAAISGLSQELTVLFIEHDMNVVFRFASRIIVMVGGRILAQGTPQEIGADPRVREVYLGKGRHG